MDTTTGIPMLLSCGRLQSAMVSEFDIPGTRTMFGDKAFFVAGPQEWNAMPVMIRNTEVFAFKCAFKHTFNMIYSYI